MLGWKCNESNKNNWLDALQTNATKPQSLTNLDETNCNQPETLMHSKAIQLTQGIQWWL